MIKKTILFDEDSSYVLRFDLFNQPEMLSQINSGINDRNESYFLLNPNRSLDSKQMIPTYSDSFLPLTKWDVIRNNFDDIDFLNKRFDELREKEIDGKITDIEKHFLYEVLEKRIADFPNPYLPMDYEEGKSIAKRYKHLKREFHKKYGYKKKIKQ
ncbi:MAG: hypothetical protein GDA46_04215 [Bdellovibrionales bacterium]|nr:hypothetical protein [Bdellovibrionales bacterium]